MDDLTQDTQPSTQQKLDPRRVGRNNSGLSTEDISDVICILHPASPAAFRIVAGTAVRNARHVLQNDTFQTFDDEPGTVDLDEQKTFIIDSEIVDNAQDLALRFSSETVQPGLGFCFGRNGRTCDIVLDTDSLKRVSNLHFRIFMNASGVLMLEDMSTNGTLVDEVHLKGKSSRDPATRMLQAGSIVQIPSQKKDESIKFIVRLPSRGGSETAYTNNVRKYLNRLKTLEEVTKRMDPRNAQYRDITQLAEDVPGNPWGMRWNGGEEYNVVGQLGMGAFATVYKLATKMDGLHYAAKELDKRRFIKNGRLDQRLDNEMRIMKTIRHENVVQYINYHDHADHLYIIMEYVPCGDLQGYLLKNKILPEPEAKLMSRQVLDALQYLHHKRITHRDIKPDNILIAQYDPFLIKLSDFGLSKIVSTDQTFLKTFCGTLLYCAPEVFPHYEEHVAKRGGGVKRRRSGNAFAPKFHSYSQSVDIWSYAAVLWLSMCQSPPFEGVVDQTGKGMFEKIMETRLDINPLLARGISPQAVDLLIRMLNTDPSKRPTELECLQHPWLYDGRPNSSQSQSQLSNALLPISEEGAVEGAPSVEKQAQQFSQLSVQDTHTQGGAQRQLSKVSEVDEEEFVLDEFSSGDLDFIDPRVSKRVRPNTNNASAPRYHVRDQADIPFPSSSPELSPTSEQDAAEFAETNGQLPLPGEEFVVPSSQPGARLFGEIGNSALQSSGLLGEKAGEALDIPSSQYPDTEGIEMDMDASAGASYQAGQASELYRSDILGPDGSVRYPSLMGTESELRELHMIDVPSHELNTSGDASDYVDEPRTPKTPDAIADEESWGTKSPLSQKSKPSQGQDATPRQENHSTARQHQMQREIVIPSSLPMLVEPTAAFEPHSRSQKPLLGVLRTTSDSIMTAEYGLRNRVSRYGRFPKNTFVYPDISDVRIPKRALTIWFHVVGIEKAEREGHDWRIMPGLHTLINTNASQGISVNGVKLEEHAQGVQLCGRLYSGDVIEVLNMRNKITGSQQCLRLVCEFFVGEAEMRRPEDRPFT